MNVVLGLAGVYHIEILATSKQRSSKQRSVSTNNVISKMPGKMTGGYEACSSFSTQKALPVDSLPALG